MVSSPKSSAWACAASCPRPGSPLVLLTGSLLAVGLAASAPIFIEAVRDLGLRQLLRDADPAEMDLRFIQSGLAATEQSVGEVQNALAV